MRFPSMRKLGDQPRYRREDVVMLLPAGVLACFAAFPFYWCLITTFKPAAEQFARIPSFIPQTWTLENWSWLLGQKEFLQTLRNSVLVGVATALIATTVNSVSAYSLSRFRYRGKNLILGVLLATEMMPGVLTIIPIFVIFASLRLVNTYAGLILGYFTFSVPTSLVLLRSY